MYLQCHCCCVHFRVSLLCLRPPGDSEEGTSVCLFYSLLQNLLNREEAKFLMFPKLCVWNDDIGLQLKKSFKDRQFYTNLHNACQSVRLLWNRICNCELHNTAIVFEYYQIVNGGNAVLSVCEEWIMPYYITETLGAVEAAGEWRVSLIY